MKLAGQDFVQSVREWIYSEIKAAPSFAHDLGKYLFSVASGTIGLLVTIAKLGSEALPLSATLIASLLLLFGGCMIGLFLSLPTRVDTETDILEIYQKTINRMINAVTGWALLWIAGTVLGLWAILF